MTPYLQNPPPYPTLCLQLDKCADSQTPFKIFGRSNAIISLKINGQIGKHQGKNKVKTGFETE